MKDNGIHRFRRFRRLVPAILVAVGIAAFVLWPHPALVPYTTPPLDSKGTRIQLLIPRGWEVNPVVISHQDQGSLIWIETPRTAAWLARIHQVLKIREEREIIQIEWFPRGVQAPRDKTVLSTVGPRPVLLRTKTVAGKGTWSVDSSRPDRAKILDSVKVL